MRLTAMLRGGAVASLFLGLLVAAGCGGTTNVPVSGVVKVDGKPYKNAIVSFQPVSGKDNPNPGRGSSALTDEKGHFTLITDDGKPGAAPGKHRIRIQTKREGDAAAYTDPARPGPDEGGGKVKAMIDPIPEEWYGDKGSKYFEVPAGGTDQANFEI